jgi:hypothetical protein
VDIDEPIGSRTVSYRGCREATCPQQVGPAHRHSSRLNHSFAAHPRQNGRPCSTRLIFA